MNRHHAQTITGSSLVRGVAAGTLLVTDTGLSFWGGVDPDSGIVIDQHHPLAGECLSGKIVAIPGSRGSCSGSGVLLELMQNGCAPLALVVSEYEEILTLGVVVAELMFGRSLSVIRIPLDSFAGLETGQYALVDDDRLSVTDEPPAGHPVQQKPENNGDGVFHTGIRLTASDQALLDGEEGKAVQVSMQILLRMAELHGAIELIDISQAHIDACVYSGPSSLRFATQLLEWGARFRVPTTLNALSVDKRQWRMQGVAARLGEPASQLGDVYVAMGAQSSFTCAPYLLDTAPAFGEQIVWAESNAVAFANSVIGARTLKYPDFLDVCIALTGRAPAAGCHLDRGRVPTVGFTVCAMPGGDDCFWPVLGYHIGLLSGHELPIVFGLEATTPTLEDLKAFSAAFATTSSTPMFHMAGVTPESSEAKRKWRQQAPDAGTTPVTGHDLLRSWLELNSASSAEVDLISLGNPHFSLSECEKLAALCSDRRKADDVTVIVTLGRAIFDLAASEGYVASLQEFGVQFVTDTCWCMIGEPLIPSGARTLMTNSAKYAHYGPGLVGREVHFGTLAECVDAACRGVRPAARPDWD